MSPKTTIPLFHRGHYNIIAKQIRESLESVEPHSPHSIHRSYATQAITNLAISMARRFKKDNPEFDIHKFLEACSLNPDLYPLAWFVESEDDNATTEKDEYGNA